MILSLSPADTPPVRGGLYHPFLLSLSLSIFFFSLSLARLLTRFRFRSRSRSRSLTLSQSLSLPPSLPLSLSLSLSLTLSLSLSLSIAQVLAMREAKLRDWLTAGERLRFRHHTSCRDFMLNPTYPALHRIIFRANLYLAVLHSTLDVFSRTNISNFRVLYRIIPGTLIWHCLLS